MKGTKRGRKLPPQSPPVWFPLKLFEIAENYEREKKKKVKKSNVELSFSKSLCVQVQSVFIVLTPGP